MSSYLVGYGRELLISFLLSPSLANPPVWVGFGDATTLSGTLPSDQALFHEFQPRVQGAAQQLSTSTIGDTYQVTCNVTGSISTILTNIGIFDSGGFPAQSLLISGITTSGQSYINVNAYSQWPTSFPFNVQVLNEVMTVNSGDGTSTLYVTRGVNSSPPNTNAPSLTTWVTLVSGNLFAKTDFGGLPINIGDVLNPLSVGIQLQ